MTFRSIRRATLLGLLGVLSTAVVAVASQGMGGMGMGAGTNPATPVNDQTAFVALWSQAASTAAFAPAQISRLYNELGALVQTLTGNYAEIESLRQQRSQAAATDVANIDKRIALKDSERGLLLTKAQLALGDYLTKEQVDLITMAAFHGVSADYSAAHTDRVHGGMSMQMGGLEQAAMDLGDLAAKLNVNGKAVTLDLVVDYLMGRMKM